MYNETGAHMDWCFVALRKDIPEQIQTTHVCCRAALMNLKMHSHRNWATLSRQARKKSLTEQNMYYSTIEMIKFEILS